MPPATAHTSTRLTDSMLGMSPGETDINKLAARAGITVPSARNMYRAALSKLAKLNPEPKADKGDDAGPSTSATSPSATPSGPSRRGGRPRGRPRKNKDSDAATTTDATTTEPQSAEHEGDNQAKANDSEVEMKDGDEETGIARDSV